MASSEVDQKFLGIFAKNVEPDNPLLASMLFKLLGLSVKLSPQLVSARKQRKLNSASQTPSAATLELYFHIIWLSREGLYMLENYVLPMVGNYAELKVLAYKLRASFYHIFVLFHNQPPVSSAYPSTSEIATSATMPPAGPPSLNKGKDVARPEDDGRDEPGRSSSVQPTHPLEGGPVGPPPGFGPSAPASFLLEPRNYLPIAHNYFKEAVALAEELLWGSHSLRLSVKTEYVAFLYDCVHDHQGSRKMAQDTITEVYDANEGIDNDMFDDACELVTVLGRMMKRGLAPSGAPKKRSQEASAPSGASDMTNGPPTTAPLMPPTTSSAPAGFI
ncbi:hypothetical protein RB595_002793 [Gaeumannomyces hyphopodioides]